ncbi:hypothetical protein [Guyparkeria sp.]|uniref:hypothetical protein n=1 Tax=Guyparkeria sp. TaxID=2035736 RepID=UPI0039706D87
MISPLWLATAALLLSLIGLLILWRAYRSLRNAQLRRERWFQAQFENLERECRGLESALAGFGRHLDEVDQRLGKIDVEGRRREAGGIGTSPGAGPAAG